MVSEFMSEQRLNDLSQGDSSKGGMNAALLASAELRERTRISAWLVCAISTHLPNLSLRGSILISSLQNWEESAILNDVSDTANTIGDVMEGAGTALQPQLSATLTQQLGNLMALENEVRQSNRAWKIRLNGIRSELGMAGEIVIDKARTSKLQRKHP